MSVTRLTIGFAVLILAGIAIRVLAWVIKGAMLWRWAQLAPPRAALTAVTSDVGAGILAGTADLWLYAIFRPGGELDWEIESLALALYVVASVPLVLLLNLRHPNRRRLLLIAAVASVVAFAITAPALMWMVTASVTRLRSLHAQ